MPLSKYKLRACLTVAFAGVASFPGSATAQVSPQGDAITLTADANAPVETGTGITTFIPAFFLDSNPANARDMVGRLPGFVFNAGSTSTRGFAGSAGNVLIDGAGASTKSVSLNEVLQRIPVSNVERIEIIRGGAPGIDMQGFPVIANVMRSMASGARRHGARTRSLASTAARGTGKATRQHDQAGRLTPRPADRTGLFVFIQRIRQVS